MKIYFGGSNTANIRNTVKTFISKWKKYSVFNNLKSINNIHNNQGVHHFLLSQYKYMKNNNLAITGQFDIFGEEKALADIYIYVMKYENKFALYDIVNNQHTTRKYINKEMQNEYKTYLRAKNSGLPVIFVLFDDGLSGHTIEQLDNIISCYEDRNTLNACTLPTINTVFCQYFQEQEKLAL